MSEITSHNHWWSKTDPAIEWLAPSFLCAVSAQSLHCSALRHSWWRLCHSWLIDLPLELRLLPFRSHTPNSGSRTQLSSKFQISSKAFHCLSVALHCPRWLSLCLLCNVSPDQETFLRKLSSPLVARNHLDLTLATAALLSWEIRSLISHSMCFPNTHQASSYNLLVE